ncbi:hypothetical protein [Polyangium fumosum]|uniref:EF-hand domain-containing protein n=1 Tax=Polyangium fumosum TaxID=889272 RepID=A0A4V5PQP8_9BACT|nr:hypothetical protein [Polyangium fumosum]TKD13323.1 hypothetical protein E8A74_01890 [Polyangium fumosum]
MRFSWPRLAFPWVLALSASCGGAPPAVSPDGVWLATFDAVPRADFNRAAVALDLPLFWTEDADRDGTLDPSELAVLWAAAPTEESSWVSSGAFNPTFGSAYASIVDFVKNGPKFAGLAPGEVERRKAVLRELDAGRPTLVASDFRGSAATDEDRAIVNHVLAAARLVEKLYQKQTGTLSLASKVPADDPASRRLFYRNQGPQCEAPPTKGDVNCYAIPRAPGEEKRVPSGLYPAELQSKPDFCKTLAARPDARALMNPFVVVTGEGDALKPVPYQRAYENDMQAVARELDAAAEAITNPDEASFQAYLRAAAKAFRDGSWFEADEAWARMSTFNSKWYLRIGPDETYFEPCSEKAGFHVSFARIDQGSIEWKEKLDPLKQDMEQALAALAGPPYTAQKVSFKLPDFITVILNAGDSRDAFGATIGQSLPNFGPVGNEGRGRTVAMTNFYTDPDSIASQRGLAASLFCGATMASYTDDPGPQLMSTVLHEAAHNLGPSHQYAVNGKIDSEIFGGPLASTLEELKAQSAALYFTDWLVERGTIDKNKANFAHVRDIAWAFGHISRGMYDEAKHPLNYSQLAAIQVGFLLDEGVLTWNAGEKAQNGTDAGCFAVKLDAFPAASKKLMGIVAKIKGSGDKPGAEALVAKYVDAPGAYADLKKTITERWLRQPKASFVYSIRR